MNNEKTPEQIAAEAEAGVNELNEAIDAAEEKAAELEKQNKKNKTGKGIRWWWWVGGAILVGTIGVAAGIVLNKDEE